jgi:hypothetical protein
LSRQTEHPEEQGTLTPPELNPLLNPVLAQNMGRWAEVYFTSPPEKREQAVLDLVRELEAQNSVRAEPVVAPPVTVPQQRTLEPMISPVFREPQVPRTFLPCQSCGRENPSSQRFCGMCGTLLPEAEEASPLHDGMLPIFIFKISIFKISMSKISRGKNQYGSKKKNRNLPRLSAIIAISTSGSDKDRIRTNCRCFKRDAKSTIATMTPTRLWMRQAQAPIAFILDWPWQ